MPPRPRHWNCYVTISVACNECAGQMAFGEVDSVWTLCVRSIKAEPKAISGLLRGLYSFFCARASVLNQWIFKVCHNKPFLFRKYCIKLRWEDSVNYLQIEQHGYQHHKTVGFSGNHLRDTIMIVIHLRFCHYPLMCFSYEMEILLLMVIVILIILTIEIVLILMKIIAMRSNLRLTHICWRTITTRTCCRRHCNHESVFRKDTSSTGHREVTTASTSRNG